MKQIIDLKSIWFNTKRALYASMVIVLGVSIPVLSYLELSHKDTEKEKTTIMAKNTGKPSNVAVFVKQS